MGLPLLDLNALDVAIRQRLTERLPQLRSVNALNHEGELGSEGEESPCAYVLLRGVPFKPAPGRGGEQRGDAEVMVWLKTKNVAHQKGAAKDDAYSLASAAIDALNGFTPDDFDDFPMQIESLGMARMSERYESVLALKFNLPVVCRFG